MAIDPQAHHQALFEGFDMDIRGPQAQTFGEQAVDQADHRRLVVALQQVFDTRQFVDQAVEVNLLADAFDQRCRG